MSDKTGDIATEEFLENRRYLLDIAKHNVNAFDKSLLLLSSSAFGLSLLFVERLGGDSQEFSASYFLVGAWICFLCSILANLQSYRSGWRDAYAEIKKQDNAFAEGKGYDYSPNFHRRFTDILNDAAFGFFAIGSISLCLFVMLNWEQ